MNIKTLIRVQARNIIREKNQKPIRQRLDFSSSSNSNSRQRHNGTKILSIGQHIGYQRDRNQSKPNFRGLAKNMNGDNLKDLINSIQSMSIKPDDNDDNDDENNKDKFKISKHLKAKLYPHQIEGYEWMIKREIHKIENQPYGGIIADEMGLGKTMQMISLMLHKHNISNINITERVLKECKKTECTLIICPVSVMDHWEKEIKKWTNRGKLIIYKYHGNNRCKDIDRLCINYNVIITTYGCIQSEWNEWKKLQDKKLNDMKDIRKQITLLQRHQTRYGQLNDITDIDQLKKLKIKLQLLINKKYIKPILSQILFRRIVLDEAHQIKNYKSKTHKAICNLNGKSLWFMTATPIQNTLDDLYAALHFLQYKYYMNYTNWKQGILNHSKGIQRIKTILSFIMLRRLKNDYIDNGENEEKKVDDDGNNNKKKKLIKLPDKEMIIYEIEFNKYERFIYDQLKNLMNKIFNGYQRDNAIGKNFSQCLKMLLQLRLSCNHLSLIKNSVYKIHSILNGNNDQSKNMDIKQLLNVIDMKKRSMDDHKSDQFQCSQQYLNEIKHALISGNDECPLCLDQIQNVSITSCGHRFCNECIDEVINDKENIFKRRYKSNTYDLNRNFFIECPCCRQKLRKSNITRIIDKNNCNNNDNDRENFKKMDNDKLSKPSSKIKKLMELLEDLHNKKPNEKCVIFSQWTSMLDIIQDELDRFKYGYCRLDGKMTASNRSKSISLLNNNKSIWIMLISLKAGGVGLNLVSANNVFIMDIWWNPAIEDQAFDRVHRIGQLNKVKIYRIIIKNSIEQKVLKLQEKKRKIAKQALDLKNNRNNNKKQSVNLSANDLIQLFYDGNNNNNI